MLVKPVNSIIRLALESAPAGYPMGNHVNVMHFAKPTATDVTMADFDALDAELTAKGFFEAYRALFAPAFFIGNRRYSGVTGTEPLNTLKYVLLAGTRTVTGQKHPLFMAVHTNWIADAPGRRGQGRIYIGNLYEQDTDGDSLVAGAGSLSEKIVAFGTMMLPFWEQSSGSTWKHVVLSDPDNALKTGVPTTGNRTAAGYVVRNHATNNNVTSIKRRKVGRGI